jgi:hypothetical protein
LTVEGDCSQPRLLASTKKYGKNDTLLPMPSLHALQGICMLMSDFPLDLLFYSRSPVVCKKQCRATHKLLLLQKNTPCVCSCLTRQPCGDTQPHGVFSTSRETGARGSIINLPDFPNLHPFASSNRVETRFTSTSGFPIRATRSPTILADRPQTTSTFTTTFPSRAPGIFIVYATRIITCSCPAQFQQ